MSQTSTGLPARSLGSEARIASSRFEARPGKGRHLLGQWYGLAVDCDEHNLVLAVDEAGGMLEESRVDCFDPVCLPGLVGKGLSDRGGDPCQRLGPVASELGEVQDEEKSLLSEFHGERRRGM